MNPLVGRTGDTRAREVRPRHAALPSLS
jgi:hypothetical protein